MLPEDFLEFSKKFEGGFLYWIEDDKPLMIRADFQITGEKVDVTPRESNFIKAPAPGLPATLLFANPFYTERCEMGVVKGELKAGGGKGRLEIVAHDITWTLSFDLNEYPERLVRRWRR
ncbi:MAG: hypothetical protein ACC644_02405 [Candidatus Hydrothermarchaeales archaeon]